MERATPKIKHPHGNRWLKWMYGVLFLVVLLNFVTLARGAYKTHLNTVPMSLVEDVELPNISTISEPTVAEMAPDLAIIWSSLQVREGDTVASLFKRAGIAANDLQAVLKIGDHSKFLKKLYPGQLIKYSLDQDGKLLALSQQIDSLKTLNIERQQDKFISSLNEVPIETRLAYAGSTIDGSLYVAAKKTNLEDKIILSLAEIFAYDIDFALDIQPQDSFKVLYEEQYVEGEKRGVGAIVAAEFINQGRTYQAIRYKSASGKYDYFSPNGDSLKKAFIRTPVKFTRISSHFNPHRMHPILHKIRAHHGVDYAAPRGTPVKASGDGVVVFAGIQGGYGNVVVLQHGPIYSTLYGHLSKFEKNLRLGTKIKQGQTIGYVGNTGLATAPHLHYEFRINGAHKNPLTVALPNAKGIEKPHKMAFLAYSKQLFAMMKQQDGVMVASADV